ncbi:uncharacterized protein [Palaemon carinicauda]|uniref:uncharacterized protein n=1 Tax=Palaemon carinicauda TaxID=392227 RepID=UPI0035B59E0F
MLLSIDGRSEFYDSAAAIPAIPELSLPLSFTTTVIIPSKDSTPYCGCFYCEGKMASVPYTLQMTKAMKKNQKANKGQFYDSCMGGENPTRYSSKMMNSIWGQYNERSVHNFKSLQCGGVASSEVQDSQSLQQSQQLQQQQQQQMQAGTERSTFRQLFGELGQAVASNFMDNMHQY